MRFGEFLLSLDLINQEQLDKAVSVQSESTLRIGEVCVDLGFIKKANLQEYLEKFNNR